MEIRFETTLLCISCLSTMVAMSVAHPINSRIDSRDDGNGDARSDSTRPLVWLTVSSLAPEENSDRMLEMNWHNVPLPTLSADSWIRLYNKNPTTNASNPLESLRPTAKGYFRTSVRFPKQIFTPNNLTKACLGYWIAYIEGNRVVTTNCIRAQPHWMREARAQIGNFSLMELMIPGTHNTGSYADYNSVDDNVFTRYLFNQEEDAWTQLAYGVRYLDLRVAYKRMSSPEHLYITHGNFATDITIRDIIQQVKNFLNATREIVIMDFHRFVNGFKGKKAQERHRELITMLEQEVGQLMIPVSFTSWASLNALWAANKRLYIGYADEEARKQSPYLFPAVRHLWGDVDTADGLKRYLGRKVCDPNRPRRLTSAMAQLTPTATGAIFNSYGGLRNMADNVNRNVTRWFRDEWNRCSNIVATDYFLGNNIIEVAIDTNKQRVTDMSFLLFH